MRVTRLNGTVEVAVVGAEERAGQRGPATAAHRDEGVEGLGLIDELDERTPFPDC